MTSEELVKFFETEMTDMLELMKKKNADYAGGADDIFANFTAVEAFGCLTAEQGFFTRMTDKFSRISSFIKNGKLQVQDETVKDTLRDLSNYSLLFMAYLESKRIKDNSKQVRMCKCNNS